MRAPPDADTIISGVRVLGRALDRPRNRLAHHRAHAAADERILHHAGHHGPSHQLAVRVDDGVVQARIRLRLLQPRRIRLQVDELQRIGRGDVPVERLVLVVVEQLRQPGAGVDPEVLVALRTDVHVLFQILLPDDLPAVLTLHPQPFGADFFLARSVQLTGFAFKPSHKNSCQYPVLSTQFET